MKLYIFDWDGTISDSATKIVRCMQLAAERAAVEPPADEVVRNIIGLGMPEALQALFPDLSAATKEKVRLEYSTIFRQEDIAPSPFFTGALDTMKELRQRGCLISVATGKSRAGLDRVLEKLDLQDFFHASRCADETASKPDPLMLHEILRELGIDADDAIMIGDTEYDMAMARHAGMRRIAVSYGAHHIDRLKRYDPVMCVDDFAQIKDWQR